MEYYVRVSGVTGRIKIEASRTDTHEGELIFYLEEGNRERSVARFAPGKWDSVTEGTPEAS